MPRALGLDFGTTNTVLALAGEGRRARQVPFRYEGEDQAVFRSVLCFWEEEVARRPTTFVEAGPWAIERFLEERSACRFLQSFKTFAASPSFQDTTIYRRKYRFETLLSTFFDKVLGHAGSALAARPKRLVVGRPVNFAGQAPDAELALARYALAFDAFGFEEVHYVYEPVAAAFFFAQRLKRDATVLVADFGGGTSDFSLIRFEVGSKGTKATPLGHSGVGVAGDTFDQRILDHVVAPRLGKGSLYRSFGKVLPVPNHYFHDIARWNQLALMKSAQTLRELRHLAHASLDPEAIERLIELVEEDVGYSLYRAVSETKLRLSSEERVPLSFAAGRIRIEADIARRDFEAWIAGDLERIGGAVDEVLTRSGLDAAEVDRVFLTGGSSYVPAVRHLFEARFPRERIETGDQLVSIAYGLALIGEEDDIARWSTQRAASAA